jgi:hypothetical protein
MGNTEHIEQWSEIPGCGGIYFASTHGRIRSEARTVTQKNERVRKTSQRILKDAISGDGYRSVGLSLNGSVKTRYVHHLVLETFVGPMPTGQEACHGDGNRANNALSNLRWDTRKSNHADKVIHGTAPRGERHPGAKLNETQVASLRARRLEGASFTTLAKEFNITRMTAYRAATNKSWNHTK